MVMAKCNCGFMSGEILLGGGMMNFHEVCNAPAICKDCGVLFTGNWMLDEPPNCPECGKQALYYDDPSIHGKALGKHAVFDWHTPDGRTFILPNAAYYCPQCKQMQMNFILVGMWD